MTPLFAHRQAGGMAADMQRKRSSECPDGTLAPSDGQSMERAESPTPGLAQGMEPGMDRVCSSRKLTARAASRATGIPSQSFAPTHSCICSVTPGLFVGCWGYCREPGSVRLCPAFLSTSCAVWLPAWVLLLFRGSTVYLPGSFSLPQLSA